MTRVILYIAASLDGFIARSDGDISWLDKYQGGSEDYGYSDFYKTIGACIMGAKTYEKALTLTGGIDSKMPSVLSLTGNYRSRRVPILPFIPGTYGSL